MSETIQQPPGFRPLTREEEFAAWESGDHERLIHSQIFWVRRLAQRVASRQRFDDVDLLISAGNLALIRCLKSFDPNKSRLTTYCSRTIVWAMRSEIRRAQRGVSASSHVRRSRNLKHTHLWGDSEPDVAEQSAIPEDAARNEEATLCRRAVDRLPERERRLIVQRYFNHLTLKEVGATLGVTKERARQLETRALRRLRESLQVAGVAE